MKNLLVIDTNIVLLDANNIATLGADYTVILPETVIDELDSKKSLMNELGFQARSFGRILSSATHAGTSTIEDLHLTWFTLGDASIAIVSSTSYPDFTDTDSGIINDRKIIEIAHQLSNQPEYSVSFMSNDVMARIRAESLGLSTTDLRSVEETDFIFTKHLELPAEIFNAIHKKPVAEIDPDYIPSNYNYKFTCPTYDRIKLAVVNNGMVEVIGKESETELRQQMINPSNAEQLFLSSAIQNNSVDIVLCESLAGSGKTIVSLSNAMKLVKQGKYEQIIYIRASVDDVDEQEEIGFLPGLEEKFAVYLHPLEDSLDFMVRSNSKSSTLKGEDYELFVQEQTAKLRTKYNITAMTTLGLRGRTFTNAIVIIDEVQNQSKSSLQKTLTRFGKGCKIILNGSNNQIDNKYLTKYTNGLSVLLNAAATTHETVKLHAVTLHKVVRGPINEFAESIFTKDKS